MKKYKLIKKFPGSPNLNEIVYLKNTSVYFKNSGALLGSKNIIENYPEFWEEVVEKDYEILEYKTESGISCKAPFLQDSHQFYINERCKIYSIKRISDDLIITVGDDVLSKTCGVPNKILSIELINNKIRLYPRNSFYNLEDISKFKQKLFTTEDSVDIFEGDKYYYINSNFSDPWGIVNTKADCPEIIDKNNLNYKRFSTKEKAEEYIIMNKPCLSLNDIYKSHKNCAQLPTLALTKLKKLVKQKLNNKN